MSKQLLDGYQVVSVVYGLILLLALLYASRRRLGMLGVRWPFLLQQAKAPIFKLNQPGHAVQIKLRRLGNMRFALDMRATDSPEYAIAEFPARSWSGALAEAKKMVPGLVIEIEPFAPSSPAAPTAWN